MKPTQEKILSSIQENKPKKELLSVQKVELGMVDDLVKDAKTLSSKFEKAVKNNMAIAKLVNENF